MATFLELCQAVARDSGTVSDLTQPTTVTGQSGRLLRIVNWTRDAWLDIQRSRDDWLWMRQSFEGQTTAGTRYYQSADTRFARWLYRSADDGVASFGLWLTADGQATEGWLQTERWEDFWRTYLTGAAVAESGKPVKISVDPQNQLVLYPNPDAVYTLRGQYLRTPQTLSADNDEPEMPAEFHEAIKWRALILLGTFDEAFNQLPLWQSFLTPIMKNLVNRQTPRVSLGGPLA